MDEPVAKHLCRIAVSGCCVGIDEVKSSARVDFHSDSVVARDI